MRIKWCDRITLSISFYSLIFSFNQIIGGLKMIVEVYYDVVSPYSYFAVETLERYKKEWKLDIHYHPFFLGGVMQASGNRPPGLVPSKAVCIINNY